MIKKVLFISILSFVIFAHFAFGQDTISLTLHQADSLLITGNLSLIAAKYQLDAAKAQVVQARVFNNPSLSITTGLFNPSKNEFFDVGENGEVAVTIGKVFEIAGQRNTRVRIAKEQAKMTE